MGTPEEMGQPPDMKEPTEEDMHEPTPKMDMGSDMPPDMDDTVEEDMKPPAELVLTQVEEDGTSAFELGAMGWRQGSPLELELGQSASFTLAVCRSQDCQPCEDEDVKVESNLAHPLYTNDPRFDVEPRPGEGVFGLSFWSHQPEALTLSVSCDDVNSEALQAPFVTSPLELEERIPALWFDASAPATVSGEVTDEGLESGDVSVWEPVLRDNGFLFEGGPDPDSAEPMQRMALRATFDSKEMLTRKIHGADFIASSNALAGRPSLGFSRSAYMLSHYDIEGSQWRNNARYEPGQKTTIFLVAKPEGVTAEDALIGCEGGGVTCNSQFLITANTEMRIAQNPGGVDAEYTTPGAASLLEPRLFKIVLNDSEPARIELAEGPMDTQSANVSTAPWYLNCLAGMPYQFNENLNENQKTFEGEIAEVLIFPTDSNQGADIIEDYLVRKYGLNSP